MRSQTVTSKVRGGRRYLPYAFTEQGIAMLSAVLRSETAVEVSCEIIDEFVAMRRFLVENSSVCHTRAFHDRFLILDREAVYHVGASLKDAGKKCFAVTRLQDEGVISSLLEAIDALSDGQIAEGRNPC